MDMDQARLLKIGKGAFALLEEHDRPRKGRPNTTLGRRPPADSPPGSRNCNYQYQPTKPLVYQVNPAPAAQAEVIMRMHDGVLVMDYSKKKSTAMAY